MEEEGKTGDIVFVFFLERELMNVDIKELSVKLRIEFLESVGVVVLIPSFYMPAAQIK